MTPDQVHLLRKTYAILERYNEVAALVFYRRLFELDPGLRPLFTTDIKEQSEKLMDMLGALILMLDNPMNFERELKAMGVRHAGYGVRDEHYTTVGTALLDMVKDTLGDDCDSETIEAWAELYDAVESSMKAGVAEMGSTRPGGTKLS